jgi:hypothetical protein
MIYRSEVVGAEGGMTLAFAKELLEEARNPLAATIRRRRHEALASRTCPAAAPVATRCTTRSSSPT